MAKMKDSGVEWIGEIPEGWEVNNFKKFALICNGTNATEVEDEEGYYPIMGSGGEIGKASTFIYDKPSVLLGRKGTIDKPIFITQPFWTIDTMFYTAIINNNFPKFFYYLCLSIPFDIFKSGSTIPSMTAKDLYSINFPYPPVSTQQKISAYLDHKCTQIDAILASIQQSIEKLKEYRQAVITQAVTKGLDPDAKMKDSGIEWIGEVNATFDSIPLKYATDINTDILSENTESEFTFNYIDISSVSDTGYINNTIAYTFENAPSRARRIVHTNNIIISTVRTYLKAIALIDDRYDNYICSTGFAVLKAKDKILPKFLFYSVLSDYFIVSVNLFANGINYPAIDAENLGFLKILLPELKDQYKIVDYLDQKTAQIDSLISEKQKLHDKLTTYKKSLIYEYVTGKYEVPDDCTK